MNEQTEPAKPHRPPRPKRARSPVTQAFAARFNILIDRASWTLPVDAGRYVEIARRLNDIGYPGNRETVRKWALGGAMPGPDALRALARLYGVDYRWLAYGPETGTDALPGDSVPAPRNIAREIDIGRLLIVANVAISGAEVLELPLVGIEHIRARIKGREYVFHGRVGQLTREGCRFDLPENVGSTFVVGFEPGPPGSFRMIALEREAVERFGTREGEILSVVVPRNRVSEDYRWREITTFAQPL